MDNDDYIEYYEELMKQLDSTVSKFLDDGTLIYFSNAYDNE